MIARNQGDNIDRLIDQIRKIYADYASVVHDQSVRLSSKEQEQFANDRQLLSAINGVVDCLQNNKSALPLADLTAYAKETLLVFTPKQAEKEVSVKARIDRFASFLNQQKMKNAGKYLLNAGFMLLSALIAIATAGIGVLFYVALKDKVATATQDKSAYANVHQALGLFKVAAIDVYLPAKRPSLR